MAAGALTAVAVAVPTTAWALGTAATPHSGAIPTAVSGSGNAGFGTGSGGGFGGGGPAAAARAVRRRDRRHWQDWRDARRYGHERRHWNERRSRQQQRWHRFSRDGSRRRGRFRDGRPRGRAGRDGQAAGSAARRAPAGPGGGTSSSAALVTALEKTTTRWAAAVRGRRARRRWNSRVAASRSWRWAGSRQRPLADPRRVREHGLRQATSPTTSPAAAWAAVPAARAAVQPDHGVGRGALQVDHHRRRDGIPPSPAEILTQSGPPDPRVRRPVHVSGIVRRGVLNLAAGPRARKGAQLGARFTGSGDGWLCRG